MLFICPYFDYLKLVGNQKSDFISLKFGGFRGVSNLEIFIISCIFDSHLKLKIMTRFEMENEVAIVEQLFELGLIDKDEREDKILELAFTFDQ
jgi:hypothetical protein